LEQVLHAPGSLCTYEPQWASEVFAAFQSVVEGREIPRALLVKDIPADKHFDLDFIISQLDWEANVDPTFKSNHYLQRVQVADARSEGYMDRWIVYGRINGAQLFTAKELTLRPGVRCTVKDSGAYGLVVVQGIGKMNSLDLVCPTLIRFNEMTNQCGGGLGRASVFWPRREPRCTETGRGGLRL
jgi:hypothetical protein